MFVNGRSRFYLFNLSHCVKFFVFIYIFFLITIFFKRPNFEFILKFKTANCTINTQWNFVELNRSGLVIFCRFASQFRFVSNNESEKRQMEGDLNRIVLFIVCGGWFLIVRIKFGYRKFFTSSKKKYSDLRFSLVSFN